MWETAQGLIACPNRAAMLCSWSEARVCSPCTRRRGGSGEHAESHIEQSCVLGALVRSRNSNSWPIRD